MTNLEKLSMKMKMEEQDYELKFLELTGQIEKYVNEQKFTKALDSANELSELLRNQKARLKNYEMEAASAFMLDLKEIGE